MGGLQARDQPVTRPGDPRVQRPRLAEPRARRQGGRRADSVSGRVPGGPPRAVDDDRPVARGARNRRRGAWYEGGWRESRRTGLPHDGAQGGESAPRHDRGTIPDRRGRCRCGDADPPKAGSASRCLGAGRAAAEPGHPRAGGPRRELPPRGPPVVGPIPVERPADALSTAATVTRNLERDRAANETLTAIRRVRVDHAHDLRRRTGTTVVLLDPPAIAFADARGGWPGTYDTAASDLGKTFIERHALLLTGGDVYGFGVSCSNTSSRPGLAGGRCLRSWARTSTTSDSQTSRAWTTRTWGTRPARPRPRSPWRKATSARESARPWARSSDPLAGRKAASGAARPGRDRGPSARSW